MSDLSWSIPVAACAVSAPGVPEIDFVAPMIRRRLSNLSKSGLSVANACLKDVSNVRLIFASRHGELKRSSEILHAISAGEPVSPTAFSLSVLNAMTGIFGMTRHDQLPATALSAGDQTLGYAMLEAYAQFATCRSEPVLLVYADEPADALYGVFDNEVCAGALAILIDDQVAHEQLSCTVSTRGEDPSAVDDAPFDYQGTQSSAFQQCLETRQPVEWRGPKGMWRWSWEGGAHGNTA